MKKYLLLIGLVLVFSSCSTANWQGNLNCNMSEKEIIDNTIQILMEEGYSINSQTNDFISAMVSSGPLLGYKIQWNIKVSPNKIIANAILHTTVSGNPVQTSLGDKAHSDYTEYWRVRRKLEKLCGSQMILINTRENAGKENDEFSK